MLKRETTLPNHKNFSAWQKNSIKKKIVNQEETMKTRLIAILSLVLIVLCGTAFSQLPTITLKVPLQLDDLHPNVEYVKVTCYAYDDASAAHPCATGFQDVVCPADGNIHQTVTVVMGQSSNDVDITKAKSYSATLQIFNKSYNACQPSLDSPNIECRPKEGTTFTPLVRGEVHF
jgi:hypothetical protein